VRSLAARGTAIYSRGEAGGELSRRRSKRAMAPAVVRRTGWLDAGEESGDGRGIECGGDGSGEEDNGGATLWPHGQNSAAMTRWPARASPA
jgi:hypothetical protein